MPFNFYDTETTGLEWGFDNILQFSAIRTDDDFNVLSTVNLRGRPFPWVIPHPAAMLTTGIGPKQIFASNMSQYDLMREIAGFFRTNTPATNVGFNSIGYDELMLRAGFFQTLQPMYVTQRGGNQRADILLIARAVAEHDGLSIRLKPNAAGKLSFALGDLIEANNLVLGSAHDAMGDTESTIGLAKFLREKSPKVWGAMMNCRGKDAVIQTLAESPYFLHTDRAFKVPTIFCAPVLQDGSDVVMADLAIDPASYLTADVGTIIKLMTKQPRAFRVVKMNNFPMLIPASAAAGKMDEGATAKRAALLKSPGLRETIAVAMKKRYPEKGAEEHLERRMYAGFPSVDDEKRMAAFHGTEGLAYEPFDGADYNEIARRLRDDDYAASVAKRITSTERQPWLTVSAAIAEMAECRERFPQAPASLLSEIEEYLCSLNG